MFIEFFGIPRERAGVPKLEVRANNLGELLATIASRIPTLAEFITANRLNTTLLANLNGDHFISDPATPLADHDCVIFLSADAGG